MSNRDWFTWHLKPVFVDFYLSMENPTVHGGAVFATELLRRTAEDAALVSHVSSCVDCLEPAHIANKSKLQKMVIGALETAYLADRQRNHRTELRARCVGTQMAAQIQPYMVEAALLLAREQEDMADAERNELARRECEGRIEEQRRKPQKVSAYSI